MQGPINFVLLGETKNRIERLGQLDPDVDWQEFNGSQNCWILHTYLRLIKRGLPATLSSTFSINQINVADNAMLRQTLRPKDVFVVGVRGDNHSVRWCNIQIVQNKNQIGKHNLWLPLWPQSGLVPRKSSRGTRVESVGYLGREVNITRFRRQLSGIFRVREAVSTICRKLGLEFVEKGPENWNDFSDIDVTIAFRSFGNKKFDTKPATKLVNSWLACTPFIGGSDSAFLQIGSPEFNFLRATTPDTFERSLRRLRDDKDLFKSLVERGRQTASMYEAGQVANYWEFFLVGEIGDSFQRWRVNR